MLSSKCGGLQADSGLQTADMLAAGSSRILEIEPSDTLMELDLFHGSAPLRAETACTTDGLWRL